MICLPREMKMCQWGSDGVLQCKIKDHSFLSWEVNLMAVSCASWTPLVGEVFHYRQLATPGVASGELGSVQPVQFAQATCQNPQLIPSCI